MSSDDAVAYVNARIRTGDVRRPWADGMLVRDGVIEVLGSSAEVRKRAGDAARIVDAHGATIEPGAGGVLRAGAGADFTMG
jgi:predicted amidohydrolase YtcJ